MHDAVDTRILAVRFRNCTYYAAQFQCCIVQRQYGCTKTEPSDHHAMIQAHCADAAAAAQLWRMLCHVPDDDFQPIDVHVAGEPLYQVIRTAEGDQTTAQPAACQG